MAAGPDEIDAYLDLLSPERIRVLGRGETPALSVPVERELADRSALSILAELITDARTVDLLQGEYARQTDERSRLRPLWLAAAALTAVAALAETTHRGIDVWRTNRTAASLEAASAEVLTTRFPQIRRIVDPRVQMQQAIDGLGGGAGGGGALPLLRLAGPPLAEDASITVQSISFRQGELLVAIEALELPKVEALRLALVERELNARIESANTAEGRVTARLRIGRGA